ncbi:MAG: FecR family protein [Rhodospirillales bacterium]|jgi:hypothetical protein|nr:FecR family protein [Rhodospirillales bacterium]
MNAKSISAGAAAIALVVALGAALGHAMDAPADDQEAGAVTRVKGDVLAVQDARPRVLGVGERIFVGDVISTGPGARLEVRMMDESVLTLGERTSFVVVDFVFREFEANAALRLMTGVMKAASGKIAERADASFELATEFATVGIRGTAYWAGIWDGVLNVELLEGAGVAVENGAGAVAIADLHFGTRVSDSGAPPSTPEPWPADKTRRAARSVAFD